MPDSGRQRARSCLILKVEWAIWNAHRKRSSWSQFHGVAVHAYFSGSSRQFSAREVSMKQLHRGTAITMSVYDERFRSLILPSKSSMKRALLGRVHAWFWRPESGICYVFSLKHACVHAHFSRITEKRRSRTPIVNSQKDAVYNCKRV